MRPPRSIPKLHAFLFASVLVGVGACAHRDHWDESIEHAFPARKVPAQAIAIDTFVLDPRSRTPPYDDYDPRLERLGYRKIGRLTYEGEGWDAAELAERAAEVGADAYVIAFVESLPPHTRRQRGIVIVGSGTLQNPNISSVTPAQSHPRYRLYVDYWRLDPPATQGAPRT